MDKTWQNYETWVVGLWIDNDEPLYHEVKEMAQSAWDGAWRLSANARLTGTEPFTREEKACLNLSRQLQNKFEEDKPETTGVWADLLNAALEEVNWKELAEHFLENIDKESTDEDEEC